MTDVAKEFGELVFNESVMKEKLPTATYKAYKKAVLTGENLDIQFANIIANAMKDWAIEKGATHFTHWFQPMTGITAEKHESFITPTTDGRVIMDFSGKELIQGEPDASSFPSGGLRATFEARGYTAWDPTSYAFIKDKTLCIPTAFCSYTGEILDKKTPLLRSIHEIDMASRRALRIFGMETAGVVATVGPEQEYFLIDKAMYEKRRDLRFAGRTLLGAMPPKGQEMDDHYFGIIKPRVKAFMEELDDELWKLGIFAKTEHNEVAPAQHELAPIYTITNVATDHNQLTMEFMKRIALKHGLVCLLHEKPFDGINGSGKHNNFSLATVEGKNLLNPGHHPDKNLCFLYFLTAIIKAVDVYQDLFRIVVATAGNDHRLGANEAPPAIISMFLGTEITNVLTAIANGKPYNPANKKVMELGGNIIPHFMQDNTDRNRTSPFAFTGNKFEFRAVGSSQSIAGPNIVLNIAVAEILDEFSAKIEKVSAKDREKAVLELIKETVKAHKKIIFNGDGYTEEWIKEAKKRGLLNIKTTPDALPYWFAKKNMDLFSKHHVYTEAESASRVEIHYEEYAKVINIEGKAMSEMLLKDLLPAASTYTGDLARVLANKKAAGISTAGSFEADMVKKLTALSLELYKKNEVLQKGLATAGKVKEAPKAAIAYRDKVLSAMTAARKVADELETLIDDQYLPYPTYGQLLFGVNS